MSTLSKWYNIIWADAPSWSVHKSGLPWMGMCTGVSRAGNYVYTLDFTFTATHTHTHTYLSTHIHTRLWAFILTWMSVLYLSKMGSASPIFPLKIRSQIKLSSAGSSAYKHAQQPEWLVMTFQTFTTTPFPKPGPCGQSN